jgi:pimeloyl-ACP methyl ester carboxylesterase
LKDLDRAALIMHGSKDPLIPFESGIATHEAIPESELLILEGMGHDLPHAPWPEIIGGICRNAAASKKRRR